ncbi:MAG: NosD domain-containing protein, partial [Candidatus Pacearchaeota archaeon]
MQKKSAILLIFLVLICLALLLIIAVKKSEITGLAIYLSKPSYASNEILSGSYELSLREGELIPLDSIALIQLADQQRNLTLEEWLELSNASYPLGFGSFYLENKHLSGEGMALGRAGKLIEKPSISFKLKIFEISQSQASNESEEKGTFSTFSVGNIGNIGGASVFNPINPFSFLYFVSALKSLLGFTIAEQLEASVSADKPFIYEIPPGYDAEIIEESINIDGSPASIELLQISKQDGILTIETNYIIEKIGFGPEFLGEAYTIPLSLDVLNLQAQDGILEIKLVYANETLFYDQEQITTQETQEATLPAPAQIQEFQIQQTCYCDSCSNCTAQLNDPACSEVLLTADITDYSGTCIDNPENFSNKIFDCQGHTIDGDDSGTDTGIYLNSKQNNTIKNCIITDFHYGIIIRDTINNTLVNNTVSNNTHYGIWLASSLNGTIVNNTVNYNGAVGIRLYRYNNYTLIANNTVNYNGYITNEDGIYVGDNNYYNNITNNVANSNAREGIFLVSSSSNILTDNIANSNGQAGIVLYSYSNNNTLINNSASSNLAGIVLYSSSNNNILTNNTASSNNEYGIYLDSSSNNTLTNNTASSNGYGISLYLSSNNILTNNTARSNSNYGISLYLSSNNILTNNTARSNSNYGISLSSSSNNILTNNTASSNSYGISLSSSSYNILT